jgi:hypothetical protein
VRNTRPHLDVDPSGSCEFFLIAVLIKEFAVNLRKLLEFISIIAFV